MTEPQAAQTVCDHAYEVRILGGHPLSVRLCTLCRTPDWADLHEQAATLFRWGREEGLAGEPPRARLSAYDRPQEDGARGADPAPDCGPQGIRITPSPDTKDSVLVHFSEVDYVDTQVWSADVGLSTTALRELRAAIDQHLGTSPVNRVTALHEPVQHMGQTWCCECSVRRSTGPQTAEWVALIPHPCPTIDALNSTETTA